MNNDLCEWIKLGMAVKFIYEGELRLVLPLTLGEINNKTMLRAVKINSDKHDQFTTPLKDDFRLFDVSKISGVNPTLMDIKLGETKEYLTSGFDSVICCAV